VPLIFKDCLPEQVEEKYDRKPTDPGSSGKLQLNWMYAGKSCSALREEM